MKPKTNKGVVKRQPKKKITKKIDKLLKNRRLTPKQKAFCREYVLDWNATRSYLKAYPNTKGNNSAAVCASKLLRNANIEAYCTEIQKDLEKLCGISKAMIINEHKKLAFSSIAHLHNTWIERKDFESLTEDQKSCIAEISTQIRHVIEGTGENMIAVEVEFVKIKLHDKQKALDSITKLYGYESPTKTEITGKNGQPLVPLLKIEVINSATQVVKDDPGS